MLKTEDISGYRHHHAAHTGAHSYLLPTVLAEVGARRQKLAASGKVPKLFDLGCGNGAVANRFALDGWDVTGVDPSNEGIAQARRAYPELKLEEGSAYDDLAARYGRFPVAISLEVVEHVYAPRQYARTLFELLEPQGMALISTPYHGYWKNVALALSGKMDRHFTALRDHGHIKFWSMKTLTQLLEEAGFINIRFRRVGRFPALAKSMIAIATRP